MKVIIAGASGFIGQKLTKKWIDQGIDVFVVGRSVVRLTEIFGSSVTGLSWEDIAENPEKLIDRIDVVVNLAGAGVAGGFWTEKRKGEILQSRVNATKMLVSFAIKSRHKKLILLNASAIGIYGLHKNNPDGTPPVFDEHARVGRGQDSFLAQVCRQWEEATKAAVENGNRVVQMRFGHVLGKDGGMIAKLSLPFSLGLGSVLGDGTQFMSWISVDDLCSIIEFLIGHEEISGPVNCVSPGVVTNREFSKALAKALKRPCFLRAPAYVLRLFLREMADELFLNSQFMKPAVLFEKGFVFRDTEMNVFLEKIMI